MRIISIFLICCLQVFAQVYTASHYYYFPVQGKSVGIWPDPTRCTEEGFKELKNRWGFTSLFIVPLDVYGNLSDVQYRDAKKAGFDPQYLMIDTWDGNYLYCVDNLPAKYYYLGECVEHDCYGHPSNSFVSHIYKPAELQARRDYIQSKRPDSRFVIDGYKRCSHFITAGSIADVVMYSAYCNWYSVGLPVCRPNIGWGDSYEAPYTTGSDLQTGSWGDMRSKFGSKFNMAWVKANADEYQDLFYTANQFGFSTVWLYQYEGGSVENLEDLCNAAVNNGWLTRVDATVIDAPSGLVLNANVPGEVTLYWNDNSLVEKGYIIERKQKGTDYFVAINTIPYQTVTFTDFLVEDNTDYTYRVKAYNDYTTSGYSNEVTVTTLKSPVMSLSYPPDGFIHNSSVIFFTWNSVPSVSSYHFQFAADSLFRVFYFKDSLKTDTIMEVGALAFERNYYWRVGAKFATGHTYWSDVRKFTVTQKTGNYMVKGDITYAGASQSYPVTDVDVRLYSVNSNLSYIGKSDSLGNFFFNDVPPGQYIIKANKNGGWDGVNSADALNISRFFAGTLPFNALQICAGDFNNNGAVNSADALLVMRKYVGLIDAIPNNKPEWVFSLYENTQNLYTLNPDIICPDQKITVTNSDLNIKIKALCTGDVNSSRIK